MRTDRLLLRRWDPEDDDDVAAAYDVYRRPEVVRWLGASAEPWPSLDAGRARLTRWAGIGNDRPGYGMWAIVPKDVDRPVGTVLLVPLPDGAGQLTDDIEVGWHLHPDHWGHGYATEAAKAVLRHAFADLGLARVNAVAYAENTASFDVMRRLGLTRQGQTDRWYGVMFDWWAGGRELLDRLRGDVPQFHVALVRAADQIVESLLLTYLEAGHQQALRDPDDVAALQARSQVCDLLPGGLEICSFSLNPRPKGEFRGHDCHLLDDH